MPSSSVAVIDGVEIRRLTRKTDERGWLAEILKAGEGVTPVFHQMFVTVALPSVTKGGHYHTRKVEWFCVVQGTARLVLHELATDQRLEVQMGEGNLVTVRIPPGVGHAITNTGEDAMMLLVYAEEVFDPDDLDTFDWTES
jgi:UDP-2-acetamido-2,6-beta-L-arabino-hexul-4-ose reductase